MRTLIGIALASLAVAIGGCGGGDDDDSTTTKESTTATQSSSAPATKSGSLDEKPEVVVSDDPAPQELVERDLIQGSGPEAQAGDEVVVQYVGVNYADGSEFDSSWGGEPFSFILGEGAVIAGWDQGIEGMQKGGRRELIVPPELAYGPEGYPPVIGPDETLVFVVDLVEIG